MCTRKDNPYPGIPHLNAWRFLSLRNCCGMQKQKLLRIYRAVAHSTIKQLLRNCNYCVFIVLWPQPQQLLRIYRAVGSSRSNYCVFIVLWPTDAAITAYLSWWPQPQQLLRIYRAVGSSRSNTAYLSCSGSQPQQLLNIYRAVAHCRSNCCVFIVLWPTAAAITAHLSCCGSNYLIAVNYLVALGSP